jgi:hypothetical protein
MSKIWLEAHADASTDDIAGAAKVVQEGDGVCVRAIHLHGDGSDIVVSVEFPESPGVFVEVIRELVATPDGEPHAVSHIVERSGIRKHRR